MKIEELMENANQIINNIMHLKMVKWVDTNDRFRDGFISYIESSAGSRLSSKTNDEIEKLLKTMELKELNQLYKSLRKLSARY